MLLQECSSYLNSQTWKINCKYLIFFIVSQEHHITHPCKLLFSRSFDTSIYVTFILIFVATMYASHTLFDYVKKKLQSRNQAAPINSISGSVTSSQKGKRRKNSSNRNNDVPPQPAIQLNNNQYNPEVLEKKYFLLSLSLFSFVLIPSLFIYFNFENSFLEVFSRLVELGFIQSLVVLVLSVFPYATNQSLRRFASESFQC